MTKICRFGSLLMASFILGLVFSNPVFAVPAAPIIHTT